MPRRSILPLVLAAVAGTALIAFALHSYTDSTTEIADAATTSVSLVAQYMLNRRWLENWFVWIAVDVAYVGLFLYKGLNITAALYLLFIGLCVFGLRGWMRARARQTGAATRRRRTPSTGAGRPRQGALTRCRKPVLACAFVHGLVLGKFYPLHAGHSTLIRTALSRCDRVTVQLLGASQESIPLQVREEWLREEHPTARIVSAIDDAPVDFDSADAWEEHMVPIRALLDAPVDAVFSSDPYGAELATPPGRPVGAGRPGPAAHPGLRHRDPGGCGRPLVGAGSRRARLADAARGGARRRVHRVHHPGRGPRRPLRHRVGAGVRPRAQRNPGGRPGHPVAERRVRPHRGPADRAREPRPCAGCRARC